MFQTPILFLIFNRPDTSQRVFAEIKKQKPKYLYIASDGPRESREGEREVVEETKKLVISQIDRDCQVKTLFRDENLGCKNAVSSAIDWFFDNVEEGIILEDDCLPHESFFGFCEEMLDRYRNDTRIMHISGNCFLPQHEQKNNTYYFSHFNHIRGWATRKRAWKLYDKEMNNLSESKNNKFINSVTNNIFARIMRIDLFERTQKGCINTWDYQWLFTLWSNSGLSVLPYTNLISNIGFGANATHTTGESPLANLPTYSIGYKNLIHPPCVVINKINDRYTENNIFQPRRYCIWKIVSSTKSVFLFK